jgi:hypothetical protein
MEKPILAYLASAMLSLISHIAMNSAEYNDVRIVTQIASCCSIPSVTHAEALLEDLI